MDNYDELKNQKNKILLKEKLIIFGSMIEGRLEGITPDDEALIRRGMNLLYGNPENYTVAELDALNAKLKEEIRTVVSNTRNKLKSLLEKEGK